MPRPRSFVTRKIRNGRVKINRTWFAPDERHLKYDGRLDGMTFLFGLYYEADRWKKAYVFMHSRVPPEEEDNRSDVVDGRFPWIWWNREESK